MARVKNPTGGIVPSNIPMAPAVAVVIPAPDVESQLRQELSTASEEFGDERAGMGMGIALFVLIFVGLVVLTISWIIAFNLNYYYIVELGHYDGTVILHYVQEGIVANAFFSVFFIAAIVIASILTCGCCCAHEYKLMSHVKRWSTATLVTLCVMIATGMIGLFAVSSYMGGVILCAIELILLVLALVFSGLFNWGRNCGAPRSVGQMLA